MRARPRQFLTGSLSVGKVQREGIYCWQLPTPEELPILMHTYTVSVVVDNLELTDYVLDALFTGIEDAVPSSINGVVKITAPVPADDDHAAALRLLDLIHAALPQAIPVRLDQDLVSITDIAERSGRTRESIRLFVEAKRGPGHFPPPIGIVGNAIRVWPWNSVLDWFREALGEEPDERGVSPDTAAAIDTYLAEKRRHAVA